MQDGGTLVSHLNLGHVGLLLTIANSQDLSVSNHTNDRAVLLQLLKLSLNPLLTISVLLGIVDKGLLLALVPANPRDFIKSFKYRCLIHGNSNPMSPV